jgi:ATP-dependent protease ClpP protease subunit
MSAGLLEIALVGKIGIDQPVNVAAVRRALTGRPFDRIHLSIDCTGGSSDEAFAIYDAIRAQPAPVSATVTKHCLSGGLIIFLAASLRSAKADATFLVHPTSIERDNLPMSLTSRTLRERADLLARIDGRIADLLAFRTGYDRDWFAEQGQDEEDFTATDVIHTGVVHFFDGLTQPCDPAWIDTARALKEFRNIYLAPHLLTENYFSACRCAGFFRTEAKPEIAKFVPRVVSSSISAHNATSRELESKSVTTLF